MSGLFSSDNIEKMPLARRMRPVNLDQFIGQEHILGKGKLLRRAIEADKISSLILYGPPGSGKNAIANVIARKTTAVFDEINAVLSGVEEIRKIIAAAKNRLVTAGKKTIIFIDEIHRFNKAQQDALLPDVENGTIILIGATTHNPFFYINPALVSRSIIVQFNPLKNDDIKQILVNAMNDKQNGIGNYKISISDEALDHIIITSDGDARTALNSLEIGVLTSNSENDLIKIDLKTAEESVQRKKVVYDKDGDEHYNTISAFIKSMRGSDPDAAIYYLAKMLNAGEDPRFIARRMIICASEDVGNADPQALILASSALNAVEFVGMPEARIILAQIVVYICCAPKSNSSYLAIDKAMEDIENNRTMDIPEYLRGTGYKGAEKLKHGIGYKYPHDFDNHFVEQAYIKNKMEYYIPSGQGYELEMAKYLQNIKKTGGKH